MGKDCVGGGEKLNGVRHVQFFDESLSGFHVWSIVVDPEPMRHRLDYQGMCFYEYVIGLLPGNASCGNDGRNSRIREVPGSLSRPSNRLNINSVVHYPNAVRRQTIADQRHG